MHTAKCGGDYIQTDRRQGSGTQQIEVTGLVLAGAVSVGEQSSGWKYPGAEKAVVDIFCTHYQHMYMDQKETTVLLSLTVNRKALLLSSRSEALESLTWPAHVKSTHSLRTSHVTWNPFSGCSDISNQRLRAVFSNEYSGSRSEPARVHAHSYRQQAWRRWPGLHQTS